MLLTLIDINNSSNIIEVIPQSVGFRKSEIVGSVFMFNGKPIKLKGVNRHEHSPTTGHYVTREDMQAFLLTSSLRKHSDDNTKTLVDTTLIACTNY